jgi:hypothetical protein
MTSAPFISPEDDPQDRDRAKKTAGDSFFEAQWTPTALLPDPVLFCLNFTHRAVEVLHGVRAQKEFAKARQHRSKRTRVSALNSSDEQPPGRRYRGNHHHHLPKPSSCFGFAPGRHRWTLARHIVWDSLST